MPIYEFECRACGTRFDRLQKLSDPDPDTCPQCAVQNQIAKRVTAPSFRLAGSGWYETDFKKDGDKKRNLAGNDEASKPASDATKKEGGDKAAPASAPASEAAKSPAPPAKGSTPPTS
ncbi:MAG: zinc ribbon domain-containing protein [Rudaea sp.]